MFEKLRHLGVETATFQQDELTDQDNKMLDRGDTLVRRGRLLLLAGLACGAGMFGLSSEVINHPSKSETVTEIEIVVDVSLAFATLAIGRASLDAYDESESLYRQVQRQVEGNRERPAPQA